MTRATTVLCLAAMLTGCANPRGIERVVAEVPIDSRVVQHPIDGSERTIVRFDTSADPWQGTARRSQLCSVITTTTVRQDIVVEKEGYRGALALTVIGVVFGGTGAFLLANAEEWTESRTDLTVGDTSRGFVRAEEGGGDAIGFQLAGAAGALLGLGAFALAIDSAIAGIDDEKTTTLERDEPPVEMPCHEGPAADLPVVLRLSTGYEATGLVAADGTWLMPVPPVTEAAAAWTNPEAILTVADWSQTVDLTQVPGLAAGVAAHEKKVRDDAAMLEKQRVAAARRTWLADQQAKTRAVAARWDDSLWIGVPMPDGDAIRAVAALSQRADAVLVHRGGTTFSVTYDDGASWRPTTGLPAGEVSTWMSAPDRQTAIVALADGSLFELQGRNAVWRPLGKLPAAANTIQTGTVGGRPCTIALAGGAIYQRDGRQWRVTGGDWVATSIHLVGGAVYAVTDSGMLLRTDDLKSWLTVGSGLPSNAADAVLVTAGPHPWVLILRGGLVTRCNPDEGACAGATISDKVRSLTADPAWPAVLYARTTTSVQVSFDAGKSFVPLNKGLAGVGAPSWMGFVGGELCLVGGGDSGYYALGAVKERIELRENVSFDVGKHTLKPEAQASLSTLARRLRGLRVRVRIDGHTDDVGDAAANQLLSERRAEAVAAHLETEGIPRWRMTTVGFGETRPKVPPGRPGARKANRRVEIVVLGR